MESVFQQITEVFELRQLIGSRPEATVFQASLCLVMYNVLQLVRGTIAAARPEPLAVAAVSAEMVFEDMKKQLIGLHEVLSVEELLQALAEVPTTPDRTSRRLVALLADQWSARWQKALNRKPRPHKVKARQSGAHTSVHKVLQQARQERQIKDKHPPMSRQ